MYKLPYFTEENQDRVLAFMKENPFAVVTGFGNEYPVASHLPLNIETRETGKLFLTGHLMKNTDHHKAFEINENVLVVFHGPHCYVSASWYTKPDVASTWNYISVHAKGKIKFLDVAGTYNAVKNITEKYEAPGSPASFDKLPKEYVMKLLTAIIGFEIEVTSIDNVFKLSQNHNEETRVNISTQLMNSGDAQSQAIAREMRIRMDNE